jgi:hypothetical protein
LSSLAWHRLLALPHRATKKFSCHCPPFASPHNSTQQCQSSILGSGDRLVVLTIDTTEAEVESMAVDLDLVFADLQTFVQHAQNLI